MTKKQASEPFRKVRKQQNPTSENFGNVPTVSEKTAEHILTVREVAKLLENAGVPRTERSIINWCHANRQGITRLDCYFETNDNKYYITQNSVDQVIGEELNKLKLQGQTAYSETPQNASENNRNDSERFGTEANDFRSVPNPAEKPDAPDVKEKIKQLEANNRDLEIANKYKDVYIERMHETQNQFIEELNNKSHRIGSLETELRLLQAPKETVEEQQADKPEASLEKDVPFEMVQPENNSADLSSRPIEDEAEQPTPPIYPETSDRQEDGEQYPQEPRYSNH